MNNYLTYTYILIQQQQLNFPDAESLSDEQKHWLVNPKILESPAPPGNRREEPP